MNKVVIFVGGLIIGAVPAYFIGKKSEKKRADDEINEYREHYKKEKAEEKGNGLLTITGDKPEEILAQKNTFVRTPDSGIGMLASKPKTDVLIFEITPDEFGEDPDYDQETLYFFPNEDVVTDDNYREINAAAAIGDLHITMTDEETDSIYVRNDRDLIYYEVLRNENALADVAPDSGGDT